MFSEETITYAIKYYDLHIGMLSETRINNIFEIFGITEPTFFRHYKNHKNNVQKEERKKRESKISQPIIDYLIDIIQRDKYISIDKMISEISDCFHVEISRSYTYEIIHRLNYTYKKVQIRNQPYSNEEFSVMKEAFFKKIEGIDIGKIISIDETSICLHSKNSYTWALKGCNCTFINKTNRIYQCRYTLLMAISNSQVILYGLYEKSVNGTIFMNFVKEIISKYGNYYMLLMDNAVIHKTKLFNAYAKKGQLIYYTTFHITRKQIRLK